VVLIAALAASLVEAFWILPHHPKGSLKGSRQGQRLGDSPRGTTRGLRAGFERRLRGASAKAVGRLADRAIRFRHAVLGAVLAILLGSFGFMAGGHVGSEAMPDIDGDVLEARILMPQGTPLARTEAVARAGRGGDAASSTMRATRRSSRAVRSLVEADPGALQPQSQCPGGRGLTWPRW
jgi:multidrug efflux pump subunit AcrB